MNLRHRVPRSSATVGVVAALVLTLAAPAQATQVFRVRPNTGPPGTGVHIRGSGLSVPPNACSLAPFGLEFKDSAGMLTEWGTILVLGGAFRVHETIPADAATGLGKVILLFAYHVRGFGCGIETVAQRGFSVTAS